jgi:hypothetical protein
MNTFTAKKLLIAAGVFAMSATAAMAMDNDMKLRADMTGFQQSPPVISPGKATFVGTYYKQGGYINYTINWQNLSSNLNEAHIHFGQAGVNGGVMVVFCDPNKPCPAGTSGTLTGTIMATDIQGIATQFVKPGVFNQLKNAIKNGAAYVNLHTTQIDGEVRGQIVLDK